LPPPFCSARLALTFASSHASPPCSPSSFFFSSSGPPRDLHSFPTRRSSDLGRSRIAFPGVSSCTSSRSGAGPAETRMCPANTYIDRKSTRLNSSHVKISYAVFCLKKKKKNKVNVGKARNERATDHHTKSGNS